MNKHIKIDTICFLHGSLSEEARRTVSIELTHGCQKNMKLTFPSSFKSDQF